MARGRGRRGVLPATGDDVAAAVRVAARHDRPFVVRGSGTGLAGGATPVDDPVVIVTTQLNRILEIDADERIAWVEPGVLNLDLSRAVAHLGLHYAPDPSSQQACTIGGNVATNAGGPHCLASGVTATHVLRARRRACRRVGRAASAASSPTSRATTCAGASSGAKGRWASRPRSRCACSPTRRPLRTMLLDFTAIEDAAATVSGIIAAGIVPAALEMMDAEITRAVEDFVGAGYPRDAAAVLLVELDGLPGGVDHESDAVARVGASTARRTVRVAADDAERALLWKGRKSAFGAIARLAPELLPARRGGAAHEARSGVAAGVRDRARAAAHDDERVPCG